MLSGRDIILISSIDWEFNWQGHQEIATRLADAGNRVLYIENMASAQPACTTRGELRADSFIGRVLCRMAECARFRPDSTFVLH